MVKPLSWLEKSTKFGLDICQPGCKVEAAKVTIGILRERDRDLGILCRCSGRCMLALDEVEAELVFFRLAVLEMDSASPFWTSGDGGTIGSGKESSP